jgi:hypothetical protein
VVSLDTGTPQFMRAPGRLRNFGIAGAMGPLASARLPRRR